MDKLDPVEVRNKRMALDLEIRYMEERHQAEINKLQGQMRKLQGQCPHKNMNEGSYSRWCTDCGEDWDRLW